MTNANDKRVVPATPEGITEEKFLQYGTFLDALLDLHAALVEYGLCTGCAVTTDGNDASLVRQEV
jgi:hypothetical protein